MLRTVVFRLTLWYSMLLIAVCSVVFLLIYMALASSLSKRVDDDLHVEGIEYEMVYNEQGLKALDDSLKLEAESEGKERVFLRLFSPEAEVLASSDPSAWTGLGFDRNSLHQLSSSEEVFKTIAVPGHAHDVRLFYRKVGDGNIMQIAYALKDDEGLLAKYRMVFAAGIAVMLIAGCIVGWLVARRAMSGVERISQTASHITKEDLTGRVSLGNEGEEIRRLATTFNEMLDRIQAAVGELKEVTNNIAHDLRSPVTRIRGIAEAALSSEENVDKYREMTGEVIEECDRLVEMIKTILEIAETESGTASYRTTRVDIAQIAREAHGLFESVAEEKRISFELDISAEPLLTSGNTAKLQRVVANLLDNAIKYTPSGGKVVLSGKRDDRHVIISVADSGPGISEEELLHVFKRFYRGDRSRSTPGSGLGLSLALAIVRAHGGEIAVTSRPEKGSIFTVLLPCECRPAQPLP
jgi:heavy metal sensor kinase